MIFTYLSLYMYNYGDIWSYTVRCSFPLCAPDIIQYLHTDRQKAGMYHRAYNNIYHTMWLLFVISPHMCRDFMHCPHMTESGSIRSVAHNCTLHACLNMNMAWYVVRYSFHGLHNQLILNFHSSTWRGCVWCEGENLWRPEEVGRAVSDHSKSSNAIWLVVLVEFHIEDGRSQKAQDYPQKITEENPTLWSVIVT